MVPRELTAAERRSPKLTYESTFVEFDPLYFRERPTAELGIISRAYALSQIGEYATAAEALKKELLESVSTSEWVSLCEWIAACLERAGEFEEAGGWYESAAELALLELGTRPSASASDALHFFELASLCYRRDGRVVSASGSRTAMLSRLLSTRCPPA